MIDLDKIADAISDIQSNSSTLAKEHLLKEYASIEGFTDVLKFIYDPYFTTGLKLKKLERAWIVPEGSSMTVEEFMRYLKKNTTGTDRDAAVANGFIYSYTDETTQWLAEAIATKDLQIGVSVTTLNKVYGSGFIPKIGIMRGMLCPNYIRGIYIATEKIDGNRRLIFNTEEGVKIYTRSGKPDTGLVEIEHQAFQLPIGYVYDSECVAAGDFNDSIELRQASASLLNRKGTRVGVVAKIFDMIPIEEYNAGKSAYGAAARKTMIASLFGDIRGLALLEEHKLMSKSSIDTISRCFFKRDLPNIEGLPILDIVTSREQALEITKPIWDAGGEGTMLVDAKSAYEVNPNPRKTLLKIKATIEYTLNCIGVYEGTNKYEGMLGGIYIDYKGHEVGCGSGFSDYQRKLYWEHPHLIINKLVEIDSFGESVNKQNGVSLNCPIFKRVVGDIE